MKSFKDPAVSFFYEHAGYGYDPKRETKSHGRMRAALSLARSEATAKALGYDFKWDIDDLSDSSDFDDGNPYPVWRCLMLDQSGHSVQSLNGIDFGRGGEPWGDPYKRVVEAELASEQLG